MQKNKPFVSVLLPAYNAEEFVKLAIESILNQTYKNFEFIIIDDGSKDDTWRIIQEYAKKDQRIKAIRNKVNLGIAKSLNKGLEASKGKYIVRMDADDWSYLNRIEKQVSFMEANLDISVSGGATLVCNENMQPLGVRYYPTDYQEIMDSILRLNPIPHPASIWRRDILFKKTHLYPNIIVAQDYALVVELSSFSKLGNIEDVLIKFRVHTKSVSNSTMTLQQKTSMFIQDMATYMYGYKPTIKDKMWRLIQKTSMYTLPPKFKRWLLNQLVLDKKLSRI